MAKQFMTFGANTRDYARIKLSSSITISRKQHQDLVKFLTDRLDIGYNWMKTPHARFEAIDKEISGHIVPDKDDRRRIKDNMNGRGGPKMVDENIQFALIQLDETITYLMGVIAAPPGMYQATTIKEKQEIASAFTALMNDHARLFKHYRNYARGFLNMFKFNYGGFLLEWSSERGPKVRGTGNAGEPNIALDEILKTGNNVIAWDPYNTLYDPAVNPIDLAKEGEFVAFVDLVRPFTLKQWEASGRIFQLDRIETANGSRKYWTPKPLIQHYYAQDGGRTDWDSYWQTAYATGETFDNQGLERSKIITWCVPGDFGLSNSQKLEIWKFNLIDNTYAVHAERMPVVPNELPVFVGMPNEDGLNLQSRTFAEMILPFQRLATSQLNIHQRALRKKLYGITIYNRRVIPLLENDALEGGKIPANPVGIQDVDLNKSILQFNDAPDTTNTMQDVENGLKLMSRVLPATQPQQVADLNRATRYQAASLVQASNKRNLKLAKIIDDQCLDEMRRRMVTNIMLYQPVVEVIDETSGGVVKINPAQFREANIQFSISDGLRGIDKMLITDSLREVINMLLQSKAASEVDVLGIIDYYLDMQGDKFDFTQFRFKSAMDALPLQFRDLAYQLLKAEVAARDPKLAQQLDMQEQQGNAPPGGGTMAPGPNTVPMGTGQ